MIFIDDDDDDAHIDGGARGSADGDGDRRLKLDFSLKQLPSLVLDTVGPDMLEEHDIGDDDEEDEEDEEVDDDDDDDIDEEVDDIEDNELLASSCQVCWTLRVIEEGEDGENYCLTTADH